MPPQQQNNYQIILLGKDCYGIMLFVGFYALQMALAIFLNIFSEE